MSKAGSPLKMDAEEPNSNDGYWSSCICLIEKTFVPRKSIGESRPCLEEDFQEYRDTLNQTFTGILSILQHILDERKVANTSLNSPIAKIFKSYSIILIGEHCQKNPWTTVESIKASKQVSEFLCNLYSSQSLSQLLEQNDEDITRVLITLRPKLLKDTWKTYPAAVVCYKWFLSLMGKSALVHHLGDVIPTTLIILDDFESDNQILGLECLYEILERCSTEKKFVESGFAQMILMNLKKFTYSKQSKKYTLLLYNCIEKILKSIESCNDISNPFEWSKRDDILEKLLDHMECEDNLQLRHSYMTILPELLNSVGCSKWCERVIRILKSYCEHYGDFKALKITLESMKIILLRFESRIPVHCEVLYTIFLKLYLDLTEAPIDEDTFLILEDCICLLCKLTPELSKTIIQDDRVRTLIVKGSRSNFVNKLSVVGVEL